MAGANTTSLKGLENSASCAAADEYCAAPGVQPQFYFCIPLDPKRSWRWLITTKLSAINHFKGCKSMDSISVRVYGILHDLGITPNYAGYFQTMRAVEMCASEPERLTLITKLVYAEVGKQYGVKWSTVERNIRTVATAAWTHNPEAIEKQKRLIDRIHAMGSQVIMSSHPQRVMSADAVLAQLRSFEERGPDVVKIVTVANTEEEFAESVRTTMLLHRELRKPFVHLCNGKFGRIQRFLGMSLGVSITFAAYRYEEFALMTQPTVRSMRTVLDNLHWDISEIA